MDLQRIEFDAHLGENIKEYAKRAVKHLAERQRKHEDLELYLICTFNDVKVITTKSSTVDSIVNDFHARMDNNGYEYRQTDEYKASVAAREKELKELNTKANYMMKQFDKINKQNKLDLINWLDEFQPLSDHIGVMYDRCWIISELHKAGYVAGMNCNTDNFTIQTTDEYADWLIGQCLDGLEKIGAIHQVVHKFAEEYRCMVA